MRRFLITSCLLLFLSVIAPINALDTETVTGTYWIEISGVSPLGQSLSKTIQLSVTEDLEDETQITDIIREQISETSTETEGTQITKIDKISDYIIEAQSFTVTDSNPLSLSDTEVVSRSHARAYNPKTNETLPVSVAMRTPISNTAVQFDLVADEAITTSVIGSRLASTPKTDAIQWESDSIQHDSFSKMSQILFTSSIFLIIVIPIGILAILFGIYYHYKKKTQKTLYK